MTDDGVEVKAGGRVVKNVAGYDLMKLQIGAVGTLGVVTQVTLKVKPQAGSIGRGRFRLRGGFAGRGAGPSARIEIAPVAVELLNPAAWRARESTSPLSEPWMSRSASRKRPRR